MAPSPINELLELKAKNILHTADCEFGVELDGSFTFVWTIVSGVDRRTIKSVGTHKSKQDAKWASALNALDQLGMRWSENGNGVASGIVSPK
jgi:hypothetical protein